MNRGTHANQYVVDVHLDIANSHENFLDLDIANLDIVNSHLTGLHGLVDLNLDNVNSDTANLDIRFVIHGLDTVDLQSLQQVLQRYSKYHTIHSCPVKKQIVSWYAKIRWKFFNFCILYCTACVLLLKQ